MLARTGQPITTPKTGGVPNTPTQDTVAGKGLTAHGLVKNGGKLNVVNKQPPLWAVYLLSSRLDSCYSHYNIKPPSVLKFRKLFKMRTFVGGLSLHFSLG